MVTTYPFHFTLVYLKGLSFYQQFPAARQVLIIFNKNIYLFKKIIHNLYMSKFSIRKQVEDLKEKYNNLNKTKKNSVPKKYSASKTEPMARIKELEATIEEYETRMSSTFNLMDIMGNYSPPK